MRHIFKSIIFGFIICLITIKVFAQPVGGFTSGSGIFCAGTGNGFVTLDTTTTQGTIKEWQYSEDGGTTWISLQNSSPSVSYSNLAITTCYRAILEEAGYPDSASSVSCIDIYPPSAGGTITGAGVSCIATGSGVGTLTLVGSVGSILSWEYSTDGGNNWTTVADTTTTLNHPNITQDTWYRAIAQSGSTCPTDTSDTASFTFDSVTVAGTLLGSDTICPGINNGTIDLTGNVGEVSNWLSSTDGTSWTTITDTTNSQSYTDLTETTFYLAVVQNGTCPADTTTPAVLTIVPNVVSAGLDTTLALGQSVVLNGTGNGTALWTPNTGLDSADIFMPTAAPVTTTTYTLTVTDNNSCVSVDSVLVTVYTLEFDGMVSNLFTPNGDGINDTWYIEDIQNFADNEVMVYNIYGNLVYTKKGYSNDWNGTYNGKELPDGTYYFVLRFDDSDLVIKGALDILKNK